LSLDLSFSLLEQFKGSLKNSNFIILTLINDKIMKTLNPNIFRTVQVRKNFKIFLKSPEQEKSNRDIGNNRQ